jgi:uncharacterized glyoxalase superfamily protein PhnB
MTMAPYLSFKGDCEAAFQLYASALNGKLGEMFRALADGGKTIVSLAKTF